MIRGKSFDSWEEALDAVLAEACMPELQHAVVRCFDSVTDVYDKSELQQMAADLISKELKRSVGSCGWKGSWWDFAVPRTKYAKADLPRLDFTVDLYVAASTRVDFEDDIFQYKNYPFVVVGKLRKGVAHFNAPLVLLKAIAEGKEGQFEIVAKEHHWTTWEVHGVEACLPDSLVLMITGLKVKPLGKALEAKGLIVKGVGSLIEKGLLAPPPGTASLPQISSIATGDYHNLAACLNEQMGYPKNEAEQAAKYVMKKFGSDSLENNIKQAISYLSGQ